MYIYHNANPLNKNTGDCVIRAISVVTGISWHDVFSDLAEMANVNCQMMDDNVIWHSYLNRLGYKIRPINWPCAQISQFCRCFPEGQYILGTGKHVVAVIDGNYYDTWDSGNEYAVFYWKIEG